MSKSLCMRCLTWVTIGLLIVLVSPVAADDNADAPWARGVTDAQQAQALRYFYAGLDLHRQLLFADAASSYEQALAQWAHPKFFLYLSHALAKQGAHLQAYKALQRAMRGDPRALSQSERRLAHDTESQLNLELAAVSVRCDDAGAEVTINGQPWFTGPGNKIGYLRPGAYVVEVTKPGYVTVTRSITLRRSEWAIIEPRLVRNQDAVMVTRRWSQTGPSLVTGAGLVTTAAGFWLYVWSSRHFEEVRELTDEDCLPVDTSCGSVPARALYERAQTERSVGVGALVVGSGALAAAVVMHYLNRPHRSPNKVAGSARMEVRPLVSGDATGVSLQVEF